MNNPTYNPLTATYDTKDGTSVAAELVDNVECLADVLHISSIRSTQRQATKETRPYTIVKEYNTSSRKMDLQCPFCNTISTVYKWSLVGTGKKCKCGAKHTKHYSLSPHTPS
jgi:hypothetical protein